MAAPRAFGPRRGDDRGAVLLEFALTFPLLIMILLGMFTGGLAWNQKLAVTNGVREGSRFGATLPIANSVCSSGSGTVDCWLSQVAAVVQSASEDNLGSTVASRSICVAYISTTTTRKMTRDASGDSYVTGSTCFADGRSDSRVQVTGTRTATLEFMVFTLTPSITSQSVTRFEG